MKKTLLVAAVIVILFSPLLASAQSLPDVWSPASIKGPLVTCQGNPVTFDSSGNVSDNPHACQNLCDLVFTIETDIYIGIAFTIWIIIPIMLIVGGVMYMMGGANPGLLQTAKKAIGGAVIGAVIVLCAYLLISTFVTFMQITNIGGFSSNSATCPLQVVPRVVNP
jgi:hypothetical protein